MFALQPGGRWQRLLLTSQVDDHDRLALELARLPLRVEVIAPKRLGTILARHAARLTAAVRG